MSVLYVRDKDGSFIPVHTIKGKDGNTPVKGTEYWTEEDKAEIVKQAAELIDIPTKVSELENDSGYLTEHQSLEGYVTSETATAVNYGATTPDHFVNGEVFLTPLGGDPATKDDIEKIAAPHSLIYGNISQKTDALLDAALKALFDDATFPTRTFRYYILTCTGTDCAIDYGVYLMEIYKHSYQHGFIVIRRADDNELTEYKRVYRTGVFSAWKDCSTSFTASS